MRPAAFVGMTLRYVGQFLLVAGPLVTMQWSLVNLLGFVDAGPLDKITVLGLAGAKEQVELELRILMTVGALLCSMLYDVFDVYLPSRSLRTFRKQYLEEQGNDWKRKLQAVGPGLRINVMYARRLCFLPLIRGFKWCWSTGFEPPHHRDANMWLTEFQGVCGQALRSGRARSAYFTDQADPLPWWRRWFPPCNQFRLWSCQIKKTQGLKGILSVPMFDRSDSESPSHWTVGVINIDTYIEATAESLRKNEQELVDYFTRCGKILAGLRG